MKNSMKVYHSNNLDYLAALASYIIKEHPLSDPFASEQFIVQSNGMRDWINTKIAEDLGISMQINYSFPWVFVWELLAKLGYKEETNPQQRFKLENMVWTIYSLLPNLIMDQDHNKVDCFSSIYDYVVIEQKDQNDKIINSIDQVKLYQLSESIAKVFDGYMLYRTRWLKNNDQNQTSRIPSHYVENFALYNEKEAKNNSDDSKVNDAFALDLLWQGISPSRWSQLPNKYRTLVKNNMWQVVLWEKILEKNGSDHHIANMIDQLIFDLQNNNIDRSLLPQRIIVFGISSLPTKFLELLKVLGEFVDVCYMFLNPCQQYWADLTKKGYADLANSKLGAFSEKLMRKVKTFPNFATENEDRCAIKLEHLNEECFSKDDGSILKGNSLLLSWGKQGRDNLYQLLEAETDDTEVFENPWDPNDPSTHSVLNAIKSDILNLSEIDPYEKLFNLDQNFINSRNFIYDPLKHNLEIHRSFTRLREIETVYDAILTRFDRDPSLKPSDFIVMVPNINQYVPYIRAVFEPLLDQNAIEEHKKRAIPYQISDQTYESESPFLKTITDLLNIYKNYLSQTYVLNLLNMEQIQKKYEISNDDWETIKNWIATANIRVDYDEETVQPGKSKDDVLPIYNTWYRALKRMVLGSMMSSNAVYAGDIFPFTAIEGSNIILLGKLKSFVDDLEELRSHLSNFEYSNEQKLNATKWKDFVLEHIVEKFFVIDQNVKEDQETLEQFLQLLIDKFENIDPNYKISVSVFQNYLDTAITSTKQFKQFMSGKVNFCTFLPMRSIPFKHIFLLGMNDGEFPKIQQELGFDLMQNGYQERGDRSEREDGRYMFLETLISAKESLYISYIGKSILDKSERNPSILVSELENYLTKTFVTQEINDKVQGILADLKKAYAKEEKNKLLQDLYNCYKDNAKDLLSKIIIDDPISSRSWENFEKYLPENKFSQHDFYYQSYQDEWFQANKDLVLGTDEHELKDLPIIDECQGDPNQPNLTLSLKNLIDFLNDPTQELFRRRFNVTKEYEDPDLDPYEPFEINQRDENYARAQSTRDLFTLIKSNFSKDELYRIYNYCYEASCDKDMCLFYMYKTLCETPEVDVWFKHYQQKLVLTGRSAVGEKGELQAKDESILFSVFLQDVVDLFEYEPKPKLIKLNFTIPESQLPLAYRKSYKYKNGYKVCLEGTIDDFYEAQSENALYLRSNFIYGKEKFTNSAYIETLALVAAGTKCDFKVRDFKNSEKKEQFSSFLRYELCYENNPEFAHTVLRYLIAEYLNGMQEYEPTVITSKKSNNNRLSYNKFYNDDPLLSDEIIKSFELDPKKDLPNGFDNLFEYNQVDSTIKCKKNIVNRMLQGGEEVNNFDNMFAYCQSLKENDPLANKTDLEFMEKFLEVITDYSALDYMGNHTVKTFVDQKSFDFGKLMSYLFNCNIFKQMLLAHTSDKSKDKE